MGQTSGLQKSVEHNILTVFASHTCDVNAIGTPEICGEVEQHFDRFCGYYKS